MIAFLRGRLASFKPALAGLRHVLKTQPNSWVHAFITAGVIALGVWLALDTMQWALIVLAVALVWVTEFMNSALETAIDLVSPDHHRLAEIVKDVSAAAVVLAVLAAVVLGLLVLGPPLWWRVFGSFGG